MAGLSLAHMGLVQSKDKPNIKQENNTVNLVIRVPSVNEPELDNSCDVVIDQASGGKGYLTGYGTEKHGLVVDIYKGYKHKHKRKGYINAIMLQYSFKQLYCLHVSIISRRISFSLSSLNI